MRKLTAKDIEKAIISKFHKTGNCLVVPNTFYFRHDLESDLLVFRKSGIIEEIEIKVTKSDFKADFLKKRKHLMMADVMKEKNIRITNAEHVGCLKAENLWTTETPYPSFVDDCQQKWICLNGAHCKLHFDTNKNPHLLGVPNKFSYAAPKGMINPEQLPSYAGLYEFEYNNFADCARFAAVYSSTKLSTVIPPLIHRGRFDNWEKLARKIYWSNHSQRERIYHLEQQKKF